MSSPPGESDDDEGTVLRPSPPQRAAAPAVPAAPARAVAPAAAPPAAPPARPPAAVPPARAAAPADRSGSGDPHSPTLSAASLASGVQGVGNALPVGSFLGEFEITGIIGEGGFGIVYLAVDHSLQRRVALKEYMPSSLAERTSGMQVSSLSDEDEETFRKGLESFINEARLLAQFDHPSLVKVHRFWEANGTAYTVMPFYEGPTLKQVLRDMPAPPDEAWLLGLLEPLTEALAVIHGQQCYHRDIAPDNILLLAGSGRPLLLDFGAARRVIGDANQALTVILKPGYAPVEQYAEVPSMRQGPWTDVYALAAVLYFAITGKKPPASVQRLLSDQYVPLVEQASGRYSESFLRAIDEALIVKPNERTQNVDAFRAALGFSPLLRDAAGVLAKGGGTAPNLDPTQRGASVSRPAVTAPSAAPAPAPAPAAPGGGRSPLMLVGVGAAGLVLAGAAWWWMGSKPATPPITAPPPPGPGVVSAPAPAPVVVAAPPAAPAPAPAPLAIPAPFTVVGEFRRIVQQQTPGFTVEARLTKSSLRIDKDPLAFSISSAREGHYYVLSHAPDGQLLQFFPNEQVPSNRLQAGSTITLPQATKDPKTGRVAEKIVMTDPPGEAQLLVMVSKYPRDFSALGNKRVFFLNEFPTGVQAEALAQRLGGSASIYAGKAVCPAAEACVDEYGASLVEFAVTR